jgi:eukaryotic-like serine/threonine-protein kinase
MIGRTLGHYTVVEHLGTGGMGEVYVAEDSRLGRRVALKVLPEEISDDVARLERFEREARSLAALNHPGIVTVYSVEEVDGVRFLTMELVEGETLDRRIPEGGLPIAPLLPLAAALADAVAAAHERGVVHRDLKPQNVMVTRDGRVKVLDFGLARTYGRVANADDAPAESVALSRLTRTGEIVGTLPYMAPEQVEGRPADSRTDIFALGVVLYEMATGRRPFAGRSAVELSYSILTKTPASISELRPDLPRQLGRLLRLCLEKDPDRRLQSAKDLRNHLRDLEDELRSGADPVLERGRPRPPAARRRGLRAAAAAVTAGFAAWGLSLWLPTSTAEPLASSIAVLPFENLSGDPEQDFFADGLTDALITILGRFGSLHVKSRTSVVGYRGTSKPVAAIARELGVDLLVEATWLPIDDRVRISAKLIDAATDRQLWADSYERRLEDVLGLQAEVAGEIARAIQGRLSPADRARLAAEGRSVDPAAYEAYLRGRHLWRQWRTEAAWLSLEQHESAVALDPSFAPAWAGVAEALWLLAFFGQLPPADAFPRAREAAEEALRLDPDLAEAHVAMGSVKIYGDRDFAGGERDLRHALKLNPNSFMAHDALSAYLVIAGRPEEGLDVMRRGHRLDPLSFWANLRLGWQYYAAGRHEEALEWYGTARQLFPHEPLVPLYMAEPLLALGRSEEALAACQRAPSRSCAAEYALAGQPERARAVLEEFEESLKESGIGPYNSALRVAEALGERARAVTILERAVAARVPMLLLMIRTPFYDELRRDPAVIELLSGIGIQE